ncbi:MAG: glycosyltransferase family 4 protein [Chloroflexaceae bacterium]|nr:glycosyltransferase family 4 protein [Chloroflexaceae bacterium]
MTLDKKRILIWYWGRRGGGAYYTYKVTETLSSCSDIEVFLSLSNQNVLIDKFNAFGLPAFHVNTYQGRFSALLSILRITQLRLAFQDFLLRNNIDIVYSTMTHIWNPFLLSSLKKSSSKYLFTMHDALPHFGNIALISSYHKWQFTQEISRADHVITLSNHVKSQLVSSYDYCPNNVSVIQHGVFDYNSPTCVSRKYPESKNFRLIFFGRILPYKGLHLLLNAYQILKNDFSNLELIIAGFGSLSPYRKKLRELCDVIIDNRSIPDEEILCLFQDAHLLVAPYIEASQSGIITIAMGAALPVVATPVGGLTEQVVHRKTGLITRDATSNAIETSIRELVTNKELYEKCSVEALKQSKNILNWNNARDQLVRIFMNIK